MAIESIAADKLESPEVPTCTVLLAAFGVLLLVFGTVGVLGAIYYREVSVQKMPAPEKFPQPRVETKDKEERLRIEAEQTRRLDGYRWVDRKDGIVQIPIERAMQLLASEGMQAYAPLVPAQALTSPAAGAQRVITPASAPPAAAAPGASTGGANGDHTGETAAPDDKSAANADGHKP
jgi:hypothetical protein